MWRRAAWIGLHGGFEDTQLLHFPSTPPANDTTDLGGDCPPNLTRRPLALACPEGRLGREILAYDEGCDRNAGPETLWSEALKCSILIGKFRAQIRSPSGLIDPHAGSGL